jgi:hypothetical protein
MRVRDPKMWRPMTEDERAIAAALRERCFATGDVFAM